MRFHTVKLIFSGDNLLSEDEYKRRRDAFLEYVRHIRSDPEKSFFLSVGASAIKDAQEPVFETAVIPYGHERFLDKVHGLESEPERGKRCLVCFTNRFAHLLTASEKTESESHRSEDFYFSSTLSVSRHKNFEQIRAAAHMANESYPHATFLPLSFGNNGGERLGIETAKKMGLYRQTFCGCEYSLGTSFRQGR